MVNNLMAKLTEAQRKALSVIGTIGGSKLTPVKRVAISANLLKANAALKIKRLQAAVA